MEVERYAASCGGAGKITLRPERRFWFILAWLWGCTVREAQARCGSREFNEWQTFYQEAPFGPYVEDIRSARAAAMFYNANKGDKAPGRDVKQFLLGKAPVKRQSAQDMAAIFKIFAGAHNASVKSSGSHR